MKVNFNIECTPEEARRFFGLPDIAGMQEAMLAELQKKLEENIRSMDPETLATTWMPLAIQSWQDMQKGFWGQMQQAGNMNPFFNMNFGGGEGTTEEPPKKSSRK